MSREAELAEAIAHHRSGEMEAAYAGYARILAEDPDCPEALNFLGVLYSQHGNRSTGVALLQRAVHVSPEYADAHNNLGNVLVELDHVDDAITAYRNALICNPGLATAHHNLGVLLRRQGDAHLSIQHVLKSVAIEPEWATAQLSLGNAYAQMGYADRAIAHFRRAVELEPGMSEAQRMLGHYLAARGDREGAIATFRRLLDIDPENVVAGHMLAAISGRNVPERASRSYVEETFDQFASSFEKKLEQLDYRAPERIAEEIAARLPEQTGTLRVLDLGCGTGLCAPLVRGWARELVGVDLSPGMLERAERRQLYDELVRADLVDYLGVPGESFDVVVSADVLIYFGALEEVLAGAARRLGPGGWLFFTVEKLDEESDGPDGYGLQFHGRYAHARSYLESEIARSGLEVVAMREISLRSEMKQAVAGWLVSARKPESV